MRGSGGGSLLAGSRGAAPGGVSGVSPDLPPSLLAPFGGALKKPLLERVWGIAKFSHFLICTSHF